MEVYKPTYFFKNYESITEEWIKEYEVKLILSDIDSTLTPHGMGSDDKLKRWVQMLKNQGVRLVLVSNNTEDRVKQIAGVLDVEGVGKSFKPKINKIIPFLEGYSPHSVLFLGDQLFTDVWTGKRLGVKTGLVLPVGTHQPLNIQMKRIVEKYLLNKWSRNSDCEYY